MIAQNTVTFNLCNNVHSLPPSQLIPPPSRIHCTKNKLLYIPKWRMGMRANIIVQCAFWTFVAQGESLSVFHFTFPWKLYTWSSNCIACTYTENQRGKWTLWGWKRIIHGKSALFCLMLDKDNNLLWFLDKMNWYLKTTETTYKMLSL